MAFSLEDTADGAVALAFDPADLDVLRQLINDLYGGIRRPWVTGGAAADLGFGTENFTLEDKSEPLRLVSLSPKGAEMLRTLGARLG